MANYKKECCREVTIDGNEYRIMIQENNDDTITCYATPCCLPSVVYEFANIEAINNQCMEFDFYKATVYTDPVIEIIDCNLCQIIERALETYLDNLDTSCNGNGVGCNRSSSWFGLF